MKSIKLLLKLYEDKRGVYSPEVKILRRQK